MLARSRLMSRAAMTMSSGGPTRMLCTRGAMGAMRGMMGVTIPPLSPQQRVTCAVVGVVVAPRRMMSHYTAPSKASQATRVVSGKTSTVLRSQMALESRAVPRANAVAELPVSRGVLLSSYAPIYYSPDRPSAFWALPGVARVKKVWDGSALKRMWQHYGYVAVGTYMGIYVGTLGSMYTALMSGVFAAGDAMSWVSWIGLDKLFNLENMDIRTSTFTAAWILTKFTEPLRLAVTIAIVPRLAKLLNLEARIVKFKASRDAAATARAGPEAVKAAAAAKVAADTKAAEDAAAAAGVKPVSSS